MLTKQQFLNQLDKLVSFNTLTGNKTATKQSLDFVASLISPKAQVKRLTNNGFEILLAGSGDIKNPDFGYMVHIDVVGAPERLFAMSQSQGKVFGRGVSDMKFSIPIGIDILNQLIDTKSDVSFSLAITTDEEIGGFAGGAFLAQDFGFRPKTLIVPDGGDNLLFVNKSKGVAQFEVTAKGSSAHASRTWQGENALPKLAKLIVELEKRFGKNNQKENWNTTCNFGQISGGISTNQVCDSAILKIDFRYPETDSIENIQGLLTDLINQIDPTITLKKLSTGLPTFTDVNLPVVQRFLKNLSDEFKSEIEIRPNFGASDARHFAAFNIPVLMIKPVGGDIHCDSEFLDVKSALKFAKAVTKFVLEERSDEKD